VPEPDPARLLELVADLHIEFSSEQGDASAHLHGGSTGLVLDVDHPALMVNQIRGQDLPLQAVRDVIADTPVSVRSQGRELGRLRLTGGGKVRVRPTAAGLLLVPKVALSGTRGRRTVFVGVPLLLALLAVAVGNRRRSSSL
jgi:hypothetical protein